MDVPLRVLLVDDDPDNQSLITHQLDQGFSALLLQNASGAAAFALAREAGPVAEYPCDVALIDAELRGADGLALLRLFKLRWPDLPVLLLVDLAREEVAVQAIEAGADDYIFKSLKYVERLPAVVRFVAGRAGQRRALREIEERYRTLAEAAHDMVFIIAPDMTVRYVNSAAASQFGREPRQVIGQPLDELFPPEIAQGQKLYLQQVFATGQSISRDSTALFLGRQAWLNTSLAPIRGEAGQVTGVMGVSRNITERKQAEEALRQSEEQYRVLFDSNPHPMWVYDLETLAFLAVNDAAVRSYGYSRDEFLAMTIKDIRPPEDVPLLLQDVARVKRAGGMDVSNGWRHCRKDGTIIHVEIAAHDIVFGGRRARLVLVDDVTQRKRVEAALREKVATLETLAEIDREITEAMEPQRLLDLVCRRAAELMRVPKAALVLGSSSALSIRGASHGLSDPASSVRELDLAWVAGLLGPGILQPGQLIIRDAIPADSPYLPKFRAREQVMAYVLAPLAAGERILGALVVFDLAPRIWTADETRLLGLLAGQAAIGLEKARLYESARHQTERLTILNEIGRATTSTLDLDGVLNTLLEHVRRATNAEACSVALVERESGHLAFRQAVGAGAQSVMGQRLEPGAGIAGWVIEHRQPALVSDAQTDPRFYRPMDHSTGIPTRDVVCVPLVAHEAVLGVIELVNKQGGQFNPDDLGLLESVAAQAAVAIENAQLYLAQRQQTQDLDALSVVFRSLASGLDLDSLLPVLVASLKRLMDLDRASLALVNEERQTFTVVALQDSVALQEGAPSRLSQGMTLRLQDTAAAEDIVQGRVHVTEDLAVEQAFLGERLLYQSGMRSRVNVPLVHAGRLMGALSIASTRLAAFGPRQVALLKQVSGPLAIAIENARLFASLRREKERLELLYRLGQQLAQSLDVHEVAQRALEGICTVIGASKGIVLMLDPASEGRSLQFVAVSGYRAESLESVDQRVGLRVGMGLAGWVAEQRRPALVGDVTVDPHWRSVPGLDDWVRSAFSMPLISGDELVGVMSIYSDQVAYFNIDHRRLIESAAASVAVSMANARLYQAERDQFRRLQQSQVQLIQAEKMSALGRLVASVAHEINNPLQALQGSLELATEEIETTLRRERLARQVGMAYREVERIANIVRRLREFYRPARQEMRLTDIHAVLNTMLDLANKQLQHNNVTVERDWAGAPGVPPVRANADHLTQVFLNLTLNAIDAMGGKGGTLRIRTTLAEIVQPDLTLRPAARIEFSDTGEGIAPEDLPRVFEPFFTTKASGTGLGLAICYGIIEAHSGQISVSSEPGAGTTFTILLPVGED